MVAPYRARDKAKGPLYRLVLDHLEEFEMCLRRPQDHRPRPPRSVIEHLQKYIECGIARFGARALTRFDPPLLIESEPCLMF